MRLKKSLLFLALMFLICFDIKVENLFTVESSSAAKPEIRKVILRKANDYRLDNIHQEILDECTFIHEDNFRHMNRQIFALMVSECDKYDLPYSVFFSVIDKESGFKFIPNSEGSGAMGYMQLMPKTFSGNARKLGLKSHTPENNVKVGAYLLYDLFTSWKSKYTDDETAWTWALAQYAVGLGGMQVKDSSGIKYQIPESAKLGIEKVMRNYKENL
jgi:hypothetical protein